MQVCKSDAFSNLVVVALDGEHAIRLLCNDTRDQQRQVRRQVYSQSYRLNKHRERGVIHARDTAPRTTMTPFSLARSRAFLSLLLLPFICSDSPRRLVSSPRFAGCQQSLQSLGWGTVVGRNTTFPPFVSSFGVDSFLRPAPAHPDCPRCPLRNAGGALGGRTGRGFG